MNKEKQQQKGLFGLGTTTPTKVAFGTKNDVVEGVSRPRTQFEGPRASFVIPFSRINSCTKEKVIKDTMAKKGMKKNYNKYPSKLLDKKKQPLKTPRQ